MISGGAFSRGGWQPQVAGGGNSALCHLPSIQPSIVPIRQPLTAKTLGHYWCYICMRLPALLLALLAMISLFAADEPKTAETPAAKPAAKAAPKAKKLMGIPEIPEGVSIEDGVKLQNAWVKAQEDPSLKAAEDKPKGEAEGKKKKVSPRASADEALAKAMMKADPSLKAELVRTYLEASHQKAKDATKGKKK